MEDGDNANAKLPVILDVDTGLDDAMALALALLSPMVELVAVTTVAGNVDVVQTTRNSLTVLDWFGATGVPVHRGASRPLVNPLRTAADYHGDDGLGDANLPPSARTTGPDRGPAAMIRLATARPGELTLVCVGPLTNLAIALNVEPGLPNLLAGLVIMGGAFWVPGNRTPTAEFNVYVDPEAAAQVFATAKRFKQVTAIGLDVSMQTVLTRADWDATAELEGPAARLIRRIGRRSFVDRGQGAFELHDPLTLAVALDPSLVGVEGASVEVVLDGEERGRTRPAGPGLIRVARTVDAARFLRWFRTTLGLAEPAVPSGTDSGASHPRPVQETESAGPTL
jgi:inosine-uridine nucleoside N-ribohydrolase